MEKRVSVSGNIRQGQPPPLLHVYTGVRVDGWFHFIRFHLYTKSVVPSVYDGTVRIHAPPGVAGVVDLPPGERRARVASLAAAARIVAYMSAQQVNTLLGRPASLTATGPAIAYITAQAIHTIGFGWAAGTIDGARRTWIRLIAFAQRTNANCSSKRVSCQRSAFTACCQVAVDG